MRKGGFRWESSVLVAGFGEIRTVFEVVHSGSGHGAFASGLE